MFITCLGGFGSGKTAVATSIASGLGIDLNTTMIGRTYGLSASDCGRYVALGNYRPRGDGSYTGGMDSMSGQEERFAFLESEWLKDSREIIIAESHMISYWKSFWKRIRDELLPKRKRSLLVLFLYVSENIVADRWKYRSSRKQFSINNYRSKSRSAELLLERISSDRRLRKYLICKKFRNNDEKDISKIIKFTSKKISKVKGINVSCPILVSRRDGSADVTVHSIF